MKIGVYGGSFDPIHLGHVFFAEQILKAAKLDKILFVPAKDQYFKSQHYASFKSRCEMTYEAIKNNDKFELCIYNNHGNTTTYDTMEYLSQKYPDDDLYFIIGTDELESLETWDKINKINEYCSFIIGIRKESGVDISFFKKKMVTIAISIGLLMEYCDDIETKEVSSTAARDRLFSGKSCESILDSNVIKYIKQNDLYQR